MTGRSAYAISRWRNGMVSAMAATMAMGICTTAGMKSMHIFPQIHGLGESNVTWYYGIGHLREAKAYLAHPILGNWLRQITQAALELPETDPIRIFD